MFDSLVLVKIPTRINIGLMIFFSSLFSYMIRVNMSINILAMVKPTATDENGTIIELPDVSIENPVFSI